MGCASGAQRDAMEMKVTMIQAYVYRRSADGDMSYLLLRRATGERLYPGMWQMVTGRLEAGERAVDAAKREIFEETGLRVTELTVVPYVASFYFAPDDAVHHVPVFAAEAPTDFIIHLSVEHEDAAWLPFAEAHERLVFPGHREGLRTLRDYILSDIRAREDF
ncbi:MAG: NUDIX pyrophosphatase [Bacteroidota bacterium]|nr:NUDIX pyrophosphatase [Bacteroidota bacterium]